MRIRVVVPIITGLFDELKRQEAERWASPGTRIDVVRLDRGPASIESRYDEAVAVPDILERVREAERDGCDGVFVDCFGDPGVGAARELVGIPVVGAGAPAVLTASLLAGRWSVIVPGLSAIAMARELVRGLGLEGQLASIREVDKLVLELMESGLRERLGQEVEAAVAVDGAEAVVLGCTGMVGLAAELSAEMEERGSPVPVIDPTACAIGHLELLVRAGLSQSRRTYSTPPQKERALALDERADRRTRRHLAGRLAVSVLTRAAGLIPGMIPGRRPVRPFHLVPGSRGDPQAPNS